MTFLINSLLPEIEYELQRQVKRLEGPGTLAYHQMLTYHMGWTGEGAGPEATGKRVRPILLLLTYASVLPGAAISSALPAAAALELIHNYSLVHDDIQDNSEYRRGRPTVWKKWGIAQGINVGNGLYALAQLAVLDLSGHFPSETVLTAARILHETCLKLTSGQFLDISYQNRSDLRVQDYWPMVGGKTAALLSACCHIGAVLGGSDEAGQDAFRSFGNYLGLAFQVQDDILGVWGDESITGKSTASDLIEGKKSLPILMGLEKSVKFSERWNEGPIQPSEARELAALLARDGVYEASHEAAKQMTDMALNSLREAQPQGEAADALAELANRLLMRSA